MVDSGSVEIIRNDERVHVVRPGAYFGELGPMMSQSRTAMARAIGDTRLPAMTVQQFRDRGREQASV